jgi:hypothetical protein
MNDDELDRLLRERGARWRDEQAPPPALDAEALDTGAPARWVAPVAAAAAVAVVVGGVVWATSGDGNRRGDEPAPVDSATVAPDFVVPWVHRDPGHVKWPTPVTTWTPDPAYAEGVEACRGDQVQVAVQGDGAGGTTLQVLRFTAAPGERCALPSELAMDLRADGAAAGVETGAGRHDALPDWPGTAVLLEDEAAATLALSWSPQWCRETVVVDQVVVSWGDEEVGVPLDLRSPRCDDVGTSDASPVLVGALAPEGATHEDEWPALAPLTARQVSHTAGTGEEPDRFVLELLATQRDLSLSLCPDASVSVQHSYDDVTELAYRLNCDGVPYLDSEGTPYLPKGVPVRFAVEVPVGEPAPEALRWTLRGPEPTRVDLELSDIPPPPSSSPEASTETPPSAPPRVVDEEEANFLLDISNQSFDQPTIATKVYVDGVLLVDREFHVEGQHTWVTFPILVEPGPHELRVEVAGGAPYETTVKVPADKPTYGLLQHWTEGRKGAFWTWDQQGHGFAYA